MLLPLPIILKKNSISIHIVGANTLTLKANKAFHFLFLGEREKVQYWNRSKGLDGILSPKCKFNGGEKEMRKKKQCSQKKEIYIYIYTV